MTPDYLDDIRFLLASLDDAGAQPRVLKVIPQHLPASPALIALLRAEQERGSEIVLHGFSHQTSGQFRGPWPRRVRAMIFASHVAEFLSISPGEMEARLLNGREIIGLAGLAVSGFCAPGWLEAPELRGILRRIGFRYDVTMTGVVDLATNRRIATDWLGYMGSGRVQERLVGIADALNRRAAPFFRVVKVFLHPQGARRSPACSRILDLIPVMMRDRSLTTYGRLVTG